MQVFPNPTCGDISISFADGTSMDGALEIFNATGEIIYRTELSGQLMQIALPEESGIYFLHVVTPHGINSRRVIKY